LIEHSLDRAQEDPGSAVLHYYCDFRDAPRATMDDVAATLTHQLVRQSESPPTALLEAYEDRDWDQQLARSAQKLTPAIKQSAISRDAIYLFIDAIDEFPSDETQRLLDLLFQMNDWNLPALHVLVTSQLYNVTVRSSLEMLTSTQTRLDLSAMISHDIRVYVQHRLRRPPFSQRWGGENSSVLVDIETTLVRESNQS
jgi:hypothetical protein